MRVDHELLQQEVEKIRKEHEARMQKMEKESDAKNFKLGQDIRMLDMNLKNLTTMHESLRLQTKQQDE
jgi:Skp family chaperone for outer membrane proteins